MGQPFQHLDIDHAAFLVDADAEADHALHARLDRFVGVLVGDLVDHLARPAA